MNELNQIKADLKAANAEVQGLTQKCSILTEDAANAYSKGYQDAMGVMQLLATTSQAQAQLVSYFVGCLAKMEVRKA